MVLYRQFLDLLLFISCWPYATSLLSCTSSTGALFGQQIVVSNQVLGGSSTIVVADFDNDGHLDMATGEYNGQDSTKATQILWFRNNGNAGFSTAKVVADDAVNALGLVVGDFDQDGWVDIAAALYQPLGPSHTSTGKITWYRNLDGQGFGKEIIVGENFVGAVYVATGDFNGDGRLDLACPNDDDIVWFENTGRSFGPKQMVTTDQVYNAQSVVAGDFNGDQKLDLASASYNDGKIAWYENIDGNGAFGPQQIISTNASGAYTVIKGDFNRDGFMDIAVASDVDCKVTWYKNLDGKGTFSDEIVIASYPSAVRFVVAADFNGDGWTDVAVPLNDHSMHRYELLYVNAFPKPDVPTAIDCTNGNGNGNDPTICLDLCYNDPECNYVWIYNATNQPPGRCCFKKSYTPDLAPHPGGNFWKVNRDTVNTINTISWYQNMAHGHGKFTEVAISTDVPESSYSLAIGDFDKNGWPDIVSATSKSINWFKNSGPCCPLGQGSNNGATCSLCAPGKFANGISSPCETCTADSYSSEFGSEKCAKCPTGWSTIGKNVPCSVTQKMCNHPSKSGAMFAKHNISTNASSYSTSNVGDFNGNGFRDVLFSSTKGISWYDNTGNGDFSPEIVVTIFSEPLRTLATAVGDINGDGWLDIIAASLPAAGGSCGDVGPCPGLNINGCANTCAIPGSGCCLACNEGKSPGGCCNNCMINYNSIVWFKNLDGLGHFSEPILIYRTGAEPLGIALADFNSDGSLDITVAYDDPSGTAWFQNDGNGNFGPQNILQCSGGSASRRVAVGDVDGDGLDDIVSSCYPNMIGWYKNTIQASSQPFSSLNVVSSNSSNPFGVTVGDFNNNGWLDIVSTSYDNSKISIYENKGQGTFGPQKIVSSDAAGCFDTFAADINNDGWLDFLASPQEGDSPGILLYKNNGDGRFTFTKIVIAAGLNNIINVADFNHDGWLDLVVWQSTNVLPWFKNDGPCCLPGHGSDNGVTCSLCASGKFANAISGPCVPCEPGHYQHKTSQTQCDVCSSGKYSMETAASSSSTCVDCIAGEYSSETAQQSPAACKDCARNQYSAPSSSVCQQCPAGFASLSSASKCQDIRGDPGCSPGKYSKETGKPAVSFDCTNCSAGKFSFKQSRTVYSCSGKCPSGRYSVEVGLISSDQCTKCPTNTYSMEIGASKDTCKTCPVGYNNGAVGGTQCELIPVISQMSLENWIAIICGAVVVSVGGFFFYRYRMRQVNEESETQLTEMNQTLLRATNPLEQSQFNIPSYDLQLGERIGAGGNGWIYKATMGANTIVAAKEIMSTTINPEDMLDFEHEAKMLTQMNHPQVLRVFGFCIKRAEENIDDQERRYIVTEFAPNGSLEEIIAKAAKIAPRLSLESKSNGRIKMPFTKLQALEWAVQIASGTAFLHRKGYVHRDMKPQNVLLNKSNDALVADLGTVRRPPSGLYPNDKVVHSTITTKAKENNIDMFCNSIDEEQGNAITCTMNTFHGMTSMRGTPMYMAPEQFEDLNYSYPVDVWAYGVTLVRLFTLKWPYTLEIGLRDLVRGVAGGTVVPEEVELHQVPDEEVLHVIKACLAMEASKRPTMKEVEKRLTEVLKRLLKEERDRLKSAREKERRKIMDMKKERRIKRREDKKKRAVQELNSKNDE